MVNCDYEVIVRYYDIKLIQTISIWSRDALQMLRYENSRPRYNKTVSCLCWKFICLLYFRLSYVQAHPGFHSWIWFESCLCLLFNVRQSMKQKSQFPSVLIKGKIFTSKSCVS